MATVYYKDQKFRYLKRFLTSRSEKFQDPEFPVVTGDWLRPNELVTQPNHPRLITDGISGPDATPGTCGSDWFATACSVLTIRPDIIGLTVPRYKRQDYGGSFHPGIFRFAFARHGRLYEVVVDDRLPTRDRRLLRCCSSDGKEFWCALLEKAYAKFHGGYEFLQNGRIADAIASFARGIPDHWDLRMLRTQIDLGSEAVQERLGRLLQFHVHWDSLLMFSLRPEGKRQRYGDSTPSCLVYGRGYLLVDVQMVRKKSGDSVWLLRLQTARHDDGKEWSGDWRGNPDEWSELDKESKERARAWSKTDYTFWMCLQDAISHFTDLDMCLARTAASPSAPQLPSVTLRSVWSVAASNSDQQQPQFLLRVLGDDRQTVTLCLEQGGGPEIACRPDLQVELGLDLLRVEENRRCRLENQSESSGTSTAGRHVLVASATPLRQASVTLGASFYPGSYVILLRRCGSIGAEIAFTLRAFSRLGFELIPLTEAAAGSKGGCTRKIDGHKAVSGLVIERVCGLDEWLDGNIENNREDWRVAKLRLQVSCGHSDVASWQSRYYYPDPKSPDAQGAVLIDLRLLIHRYKLGVPVRVEVFHSRMGANTKTPVGWAILTESSAPGGQEVALTGNDGKATCVRLRCSLFTLDEFDGF